MEPIPLLASSPQLEFDFSVFFNGPTTKQDLVTIRTLSSM